MMKNFFKGIAIVLVCTMVSACSFFAKKQVAKDLTSEAIQRIETLLVIFDATETHEEEAFGKKKLDEAKNILTLLNDGIQKFPVTTGLRTVANTTQLIYGLSAHDAKKFQAMIDSVTTAKGKISMSAAINASKYDLKAASGNIAVVIISDGLSTNNLALKSAEILGVDFTNRLCLYTICVGNHPQGATFMTQLAQKTACGFSVSSTRLNTADAMQQFIKSIFFADASDLVETDIQGADADGDGIANTIDLCDRTPKGAVVDPNGCWDIQHIFFDWNKADVHVQYKNKLVKAVEVFKANPDLHVEFQGHTDNTGNDAYNQQLSEQRANNVKNILIKQGVSKKQLSTQGFGKTRPLSPNDSDDNRAKNRRVESVIQ
jgi:OOP family OmpA-OmpF porin